MKIENILIKKTDAIKMAGNQSRLAELFEVSRAAISLWGEYLPEKRAWQILNVFPNIPHSRI